MVGTTVYLKTSGEEVFVLGKTKLEANVNTFPELGADVFAVRRPISGQNGISHIVELYYPQELETKDAIMDRKIAEQKAFEQRLEDARKEAGFDAEDTATTESKLN